MIRIWLTGLLGLAGLVNATYLTVQHYREGIVPCSLHGCETVLSSKYAVVYRLPVSLFGVLFFVALLLLIAAGDRYRRLVRILIALGLVFGAYLLYIMLAKIQALCQYCLFNDSVLILLAFVQYFPRRSNSKTVQEDRS
jgi:uncharacterized membrane protein